MDRPELLFENALRAFLTAESDLLLDDVSERNTCGRLSIYVERQLQTNGLRGYYADVEYNRKQQGEVKTIVDHQHRIVQITPDLIVHTRGKRPPPYDNLIAVEVKKSSRSETGKDLDRARRKALTRTPHEDVWGWNRSHPEHVCGYAVGIFMEIDLVQRKIILEFFEKGIQTKQDRIPIEENRCSGYADT